MEIVGERNPAGATVTFRPTLGQGVGPWRVTWKGRCWQFGLHRRARALVDIINEHLELLTLVEAVGEHGTPQRILEGHGANILTLCGLEANGLIERMRRFGSAEQRWRIGGTGIRIVPPTTPGDAA